MFSPENLVMTPDSAVHNRLLVSGIERKSRKWVGIRLGTLLALRKCRKLSVGNFQLLQ